eukprot:TRINITY_DN31947_c0_g1_i1.p1 TRINITY_DN31947_c0_g1~~TRINITY_DN31947_c0_g1_i1.p1  ORF type:complete len:1043 (+),score=309.32 TRINITY_DN31947_c0_g1_i1:114-3242(+)
MSTVQLVLDSIGQAIMGAQSEIFMFVIAIFSHWFLYGGSKRIGRWFSSNRKAEPLKKASTGRGGAKTSPLTPGAKLAKTLETVLQSGNADRMTLGRHLRAHIEKTEGSAEAVLADGLMKLPSPGPTGASHSKALSAAAEVDLLAAVRDILGEKGLPQFGGVHLAEALLRRYYGLRRTTEFEEIWKAVQDYTPSITLPAGVRVLAVQAALVAGNVQLAVQRLAKLSDEVASSPPTSSAGLGEVLQRILRTAAQQNVLRAIVKDLLETGIMGNVKAVEAMFMHLSKNKESETLQLVTEWATTKGMQLTGKSYAALISSSSTPEAAMKLLKDAASSADSDIADVLQSAAERAGLFADAALAGAVVDAATAMQSSASPEMAAQILLLARPGGPLVQRGNMEQSVLSLFSSKFAQVDIAVSVDAQRLVAEAAIRAGRKEVLQSLLASASNPARRATLLKVVAASAPLADATVLLDACPDKAAAYYNALLDSYACRGDTTAVRKVLAAATEAGMADATSYNMAMKLHLKTRDTQKARQVIVDMKRAGLEPNIATFNELLDVTVLGKGDTTEAWRLIEEMNSLGIKPTRVTCAVMLKSVQPNLGNEHFQKALALADTLSDESVDGVLLSSVVEACIRMERKDVLAKRLKKHAPALGVSLTSCHAYGTLIRAYGYLNHLDAVWATWRQLKTRRVELTSITIGCMVEALVLNGDPAGGYELIREILADPQTRQLMNAVIYGSVLKGFSHQKRFDLLWSAYQEMMQEGIQLTASTYNTLIDACARNGEMSRVQKLLQEMVRQGIQPNVITHSAIIKGYCQEGRIESALEVMEEMRANPALRPDEHTYNTVINGCARQGLYDKGMGMLQEMCEAGIRPTNFTLSVLMKLAGRGRHLEGAFEMVNNLSKKYRLHPNVQVYNNLIQACIGNRATKRAFEEVMVERMVKEGVRPDTRTYALLLRAYIDANEIKDAAGILCAALGLRGAHALLRAAPAASLQPRDSLDASLVAETLDAIARSDQAFAKQLLEDLQHLPGCKIDVAQLRRRCLASLRK